MARKWKLKQGPKTCNVTVEREGKVVTVKCEEGRIYEGDEFAKWCPSVLVEVPSAVVQSIPVPPVDPVVRREYARPEIPPVMVKGVGIDLKATMEKKHVEAPMPPPPPPEPEVPSAQEPETEPPEAAPEPEPEKPREKKGKLRKRGR